jgi:hypothetical protein
MASILFTQFEVGRILGGNGIVLPDDATGAEYYVRIRGSEDNEVIDARNLPTVWVDLEQLREVAFGRAATGYVSDDSAEHGRTVTLRLATLAEYRASLARASAWFERNALPGPPDPTDEQIVPLLTPLQG